MIEQRNHNLDVINDITPEGMFSIMKDNATVAAWVEHFPFAHPDPTLPSILINHKVAPFDEQGRPLGAGARRSTSAPSRSAPIAERPISRRSACRRPARPRPTTTSRCSSGSPTSSSIPARSKIKPYNPNIATELADLVRPTWGDAIPTDEAELKRVFGYGWWKQDLTAAAELLTRAGFTKQGNRWMKPDGTPFSFRVQVEGDAIPTLARAGTVIAQQWQEFGIDAKVVVAGPTHGQLLGSGDFDTAIAWTIETWGGHPDMSFFLESFHSDYIKPLGEVQPPRNLQRWEDQRLDAIIEANRTVAFDSPEVVQARHGLPQARRRGDADDPADGLQQVRPVRHDLLDGLPEHRQSLRGVRPQLVEPALHDCQPEAEPGRAQVLGRHRRSGLEGRSALFRPGTATR